MCLFCLLIYAKLLICIKLTNLLLHFSNLSYTIYVINDMKVVYMKKIKNRIYKGNEEYKFKLWEKILIAIVTPIVLFLGAPFSMLFIIISAIIIVNVLGIFGYFLLVLFAIMIYIVIKSFYGFYLTSQSQHAIIRM